MQRRSPFFASLLIAGLLASFLVLPAQAQSPTPVTSILNSGSGTAMEVTYSGGLLAPGKFADPRDYSAPNDSIPAEGAGVRMMWYPAKAAFRSGRVNGSSWDASNVGEYSVAFGLGTEASGGAAFAVGSSAVASGGNATAMGLFTSASGGSAVAAGTATDAATGESVSIGECNSANTSADGTLLAAGNGSWSVLSGCESRSDAMVLTRSGELTAAASIESESGGFILPDGTVLNEAGDLEGLPTNSSGAFDLSNEDGLVASGTFDSGSVPATGVGTRMMWYPAKAAFRAGRVGNNLDGTQWDASKVGRYSVAFGVDTKASGGAATSMGFETTASGGAATSMGLETTASGEAATATGLNTTASGSNATSMGFQTTASGDGATAMGILTDAVGDRATAMGFETTATGDRATAMGTFTAAATNGSLSIGEFNSANTSGDNTLFVAGNGSDGDRSDALVLSKNGELTVTHTGSSGFVADLTASRTGTPAGDTPEGNVARIANFGGQGADVLALQGGLSNPTDGVNYLSFYDEDGNSVGAVEGNGSGGVRYKTSGSDYAEELSVVGGKTTPEPTEVVGVRGGAVSLTTDEADRLMVVTDRAAVLGNASDSGAEAARRVAVAFVGQVPAKVRGSVDTGDLIVASGQNDGTARAVSPENYRRSGHGPIAGQAWSSKLTEGVGEVTVAVGLGRSGAVAQQLEEERNHNQEQQERIAELEAENQKVKKRLAALEEGHTSSLPAGLVGPWVLALLLGLGGLAAGFFWRGRA